MDAQLTVDSLPHQLDCCASILKPKKATSLHKENRLYECASLLTFSADHYLTMTLIVSQDVNCSFLVWGRKVQ